MEPWREELYHSELYHYGVKGMKWRKRKKSGFLGRIISTETHNNPGAEGVEKALGNRRNRKFERQMKIAIRRRKKIKGDKPALDISQDNWKKTRNAKNRASSISKSQSSSKPKWYEKIISEETTFKPSVFDDEKPIKRSNTKSNKKTKWYQNIISEETHHNIGDREVSKSLSKYRNRKYEQDMKSVIRRRNKSRK